MLVVSWNVNSVRARMERLRDFLRRFMPDICLLQELKCTEADFPGAELKAAGYHIYGTWQKTWNGVAILSREPFVQSEHQLPGVENDEARFLAVSRPGLRVVNVYAPNGRHVGHEKYDEKLAWYGHLRRYVGSLEDRAHLVMGGDFNVAPQDEDVHDPKKWHESILCSTPERQALAGVLQAGELQDLFRLKNDGPGYYSWWDYRGLGFQMDKGLRIDFLLGGQAIAAGVAECWIERDERRAPKDRQKPSDHAPVMARIND